MGEEDQGKETFDILLDDIGHLIGLPLPDKVADGGGGDHHLHSSDPAVAIRLGD